MTVDHGLRARSAEESAETVAWLRAWDVPSEVLPWTGPKPASRIQEAARQSRYGLLTSACARLGILHLLLAHHADDQAETVAMRLARRTGTVGRAGMASIRELAGCRLLRPLLSVSKQRLVATLQALAQPWHDDPSNLSLRFERAALRLKGGLLPAPLWTLALDAGRERSREELQVSGLLARAAHPSAFGHVALDRAALATISADMATAVLGYVIRSVAGAPYPVPRDRLRHLAAALETEGNGTRRSLAGCLVRWTGCEILITREPGRVRHAIPLLSDLRTVWDGRFDVTCGEVPEGLTLRALGRNGREALPVAVRAALRAARIPLSAVESLPATFGEDLVGCPTLDWWQREPLPVKVVPRPLHPVAPPPHFVVDVV